MADPPLLVAPTSSPDLPDLAKRYHAVRALTRRLCEPLEVEDYVVQSMADVSPTKWHLAHATWFFERFVLTSVPGYRCFHPRYDYLFNSYYQTVGPMHARPKRGLLSRPTVAEVWTYRAHVDAAMERLFEAGDVSRAMQGVVELGVQHEQQHQELILTDILHVLWNNPLWPAYVARDEDASSGPAPRFGWVEHAGGEVWVGAPKQGPGFSYDNEQPRHRGLLEPFCLGSRLVTQGEYLEFMHDGGYARPELWLADGWQLVQAQGWQAPLYWVWQDGAWHRFGLDGLQPVDAGVPVVHVSYYEADAFARWRRARLPTEVEWEVLAATQEPQHGNLLERRAFGPRTATAADAELTQLFGDAWEWTGSPYAPYPGYRPWSGSLGEYNGKFMCNQVVLRGGSCATPVSHIRASYRNFFPPQARWQFSGIRLARDLSSRRDAPLRL